MSVTYEQFVEYFKGKNVAVIGSGSSILNRDNGRDIDLHDIVVRVNRGYPYERYRQFVGTRTDVWAFGMADREDLRCKFHKMFCDRKYSLYTWFDASWIPAYLKEDPRHITLPPTFSRAAKARCSGVTATTGMDTLHFLIVGTEYKNISIYGMDFYKTEYWFKEEDNSIAIEYTTKVKKSTHAPNAEENFLKELMQTYPNISMIT